jgi:predicted alpha/beta superfamily hydrolase
MNRTSLLLILLFLPGPHTTGALAQSSQPPLITFPRAEVHHLQSHHVGSSFDIRVLLPPTIPGEQTRFPVVYVTDATGEMVVSDTAMRLLLFDTPRFIVVGIGYPDAESYFQTMALRQRDLTPSESSYTPGGASFAGRVMPQKTSGGAPRFLDFIRDELIPFIDSKYPTIPGDRTYAGHSFGGLFGSYTLFTHPDTFRRYVIGSPSLSWEKGEIFPLANST